LPPTPTLSLFPYTTLFRSLDLPLARQHQVLRLDVTMHHAVLVGVLQSEGRLPCVIAGLDDREGSTLLDEARQADAFDVLHDEEMHIARLLGVMRGDNIRM